MPYRYVIDKERRLVISTGWDHLTFAEAKAHQDQLKNDPDLVPEFNQLLDTTRVKSFEITFDEARVVANGSLFFSPSSRRAWVTTQPFIYGIARTIEVYREIAGSQDQFCVFYDLNAALEWLGVEDYPLPESNQQKTP